KRAVKRQREYGYAQGILKSWNNKGIKTLEQAKAEEVSFQNKSQNNQNKFQQQKPVKKAPEWSNQRFEKDEETMTAEEFEEYMNGLDS
ncbi:DnaD domain protein, partial [Lactococcus lactis]